MDILTLLMKTTNLLGPKAYDAYRQWGLTHNHINGVGRCDLYRYCKNKLTPRENWIPIRITGGMYEYEYFNVCFLNNVLALIIQALAEHKIPYIDICNSQGQNIWEMFFEQPFLTDNPGKDAPVMNPKTVQLFPGMEEIYSAFDRKLWGRVYHDFVRFNQPTQEYIQAEYNNILANKAHVLGVLMRGTDYTASKPAGHPVQPEIADVISHVKEKLSQCPYDGIYLATEDGRLAREFSSHFPDFILTNERVYYDEVFRQNQLSLIKDVHFQRENDDYKKGVEYLSSLYLLSHCNSIIAGNCGGTQMAVFMNNNSYEYTHIFRLGMYEEGAEQL